MRSIDRSSPAVGPARLGLPRVAEGDVGDRYLASVNRGQVLPGGVRPEIELKRQVVRHSPFGAKVAFHHEAGQPDIGARAQAQQPGVDQAGAPGGQCRRPTVVDVLVFERFFCGQPGNAADVRNGRGRRSCRGRYLRGCCRGLRFDCFGSRDSLCWPGLRFGCFGGRDGRCGRWLRLVGLRSGRDGWVLRFNGLRSCDGLCWRGLRFDGPRSCDRRRWLCFGTFDRASGVEEQARSVSVTNNAVTAASSLRTQLAASAVKPRDSPNPAIS